MLASNAGRCVRCDAAAFDAVLMQCCRRADSLGASNVLTRCCHDTNSSRVNCGRPSPREGMLLLRLCRLGVCVLCV